MVERIEIGRGLTIPISGEPAGQVDVKETGRVGLVAADYIGMRPTMLVAVGDSVELGQPLFEDKKTPGVIFTSPAAGKVVEVNRGEKRAFQSVVIQREGQASRSFLVVDADRLGTLGRQQIVEQLVASGLWTALRVRPYSKVPSPSGPPPHSIFINAMDTNPLAVRPELIVQEQSEAFAAGVRILSQLTAGKTYVCRTPGSKLLDEGNPGVILAEFDGPHPAGLVGTHMHMLSPVNANRNNWYINYQDAIAVGHLFLSGKLDPTRIISLAGPSVKNPRILRTSLGASLEELVSGELVAGEHRVVSGSILNGRAMQSPCGYLGRYSLQVSVLEEGTQREFLGWQMPGFNRYSVTRAFASAIGSAAKKFALNTSLGGSERAMVPIGVYEKVMPLDMIPTLLLRSLISRDTTTAQDLGCLELDEEDLALCTFVCPGKYDYGSILRDNLMKIEKEG
ncbi:MAG TPA: NADH:ubiquinone reductase (Na(+)-transporting) subunit A [Planctomycetaceae bacterium]|nr:NADH:ubiquinone reductase (Na(+)-transporting) subunit A [Planctomycetaceae bacterium]